MNYTQGEWKVTKWSSHNEIHVSAEYDNNLHFVANCGHTGEDETLPYNKEAEANAHLISASPDMYEALNNLYNKLTSMKTITTDPEANKLLRDAQKALCKAEGR